MRAHVVWCVMLLASVANAAELKVVAKVKVHNAAAVPMNGVVVRGTLPVPKDYEKDVRGLALRDGDKVLPTQVNVFATYAGSEKDFPVGRPEVVQLSAKVDLPANGIKQFDVVELAEPPKDAPAAASGDALATLGKDADAVVVEATDAFGNRYRCEPLNLHAADATETRIEGPLVSEGMFQSTMKLVGKAAPDKPAFKRFFRVRAYLTLYAGEESASLALMIHNGSIESPNGPVYYRSIRVGIRKPIGVHVWEQKFSPAAKSTPKVEGEYTWIDCPAPHPDKKVFVMPARAAAVLRTVVYAPKAKQRALLFAKHQPFFVPVPSQTLWSWSNFKTARYGSNKYPLPLSFPRPAVDKFIRRSLGAPNRSGWKRFGHAMPAGVPYGGMTGGSGIYYVFGIPAAVSGDNNAIRRNVILADRHWDRHHGHRFHEKDGKPYVHSRQVVQVGGRKMLQVSLNRRGFVIDVSKDPAAAAQAKHVADNKLLSPQAKEFLRYMNHDDQHLARVFDATPAAYLACDAISRDRLILASTHACATLNIYPFRSKPKTGGFGSLVNTKKGVEARPGRGVGFGRAHGWLTHALGYAFCLSQDPAVRKDCLDVAKVYTGVLAKGQTPAGHITIHRPYSKSLKGEYWYVNTWQSVGIMADGARTLVNMLSTPEDQAHADRLIEVYKREGKWSATVAWNEKLKGIVPSVALRKKGAKQPLPKPWFPPDKVMRGGHYFGTPYIWYYELTGDKLFLDRLKAMTGGNVLRHSQGNYRMWSYALWFAQGGQLPGRPGLAEK